MIRKLLFTAAITASLGLQAQDKLQVGTGTVNKRQFAPPAQSNNLLASVSDTLHYFFNKHYYRNSMNPVPPSTNPENVLFYTVPSPYTTSLSLTHCGSIFQNSVSIQVVGLEGIAARNAGSVSQSVTVRLYLCNLNSSNLPIMPPLDSVTTSLASTQNGDWIGGNFTNGPVTVTGKFAVLIKNASTNTGDTIRPFMNNASTPTSTVPVRHRYGEGLGLIRLNGNFLSTNQGFSGSGPDYEFLVAPRVTFSLTAGISVPNPTICTNSAGSFVNASAPVGLIEHRQFNFNKFYKHWYPWALTTNSLILNRSVDSIYDWTFTGSSTTQSYAKNPTVTFNVGGIQNAGLSMKYKPSAQVGVYPSLSDAATATINVSNSAAPVISVSGPTVVCAGSSATLTASGNPTFTWTSPSSNASSVVVAPNVTTIYTVSASNGGCISSQTFSLFVNNTPTVTVASPTGACVSSLFTLTASGANSFVWGNSATTASTSVLSNTPGFATFTVTGTNEGCPPSVVVTNVLINDKPLVSIIPQTNFVCSKAQGGLPITLDGDPAGGKFSGQGVTAGKFTPNNTGTFTASYSYTDASTGCANNATTAIVVSICSGVNEGQLNSQLRIYPNPSVNGQLTVGNLEGSNRISVYNLLGSLVLQETTHFAEYNLDLSSQAEGTYFMRITDSNGDMRTVKIVNRR